MESTAKSSVADDSEVCGLTRKEISLILKGHLKDNATIAYVEIEKSMSDRLERPFALSDSVKHVLRKLLHDLKIKWQQACRTEEKFLRKFSEWLSVFVSFEETEQASEKSNKMGLPSSEFTESSDRTKRRRTEELRAQKSIEELAYATQMSLRSSGKSDAANIVRDVGLGSPSKVKKYKESIDSIQETTFSNDAALSLIVELKLSRSQYQGLRNRSKENGCNLFPPYKLPYQAKLKCYPPKSDISVNECSAEVKLQVLLNHTVDRILLTQIDVVKSLSPENIGKLNLICKWGCDGTSGQSAYKQKFTNDDGSKSDANIFFTSIVPLQLVVDDQETNARLVVWKNPRPSSPRFCRPIRIQFLHENTQATRDEMEYIKQQEHNLVPFEKIIDGKKITVSFQLALTMIDGKVCNAITNNASTQRCYLCKATSKDFNNIDAILKKEVSRDHLQFGLSTLHAWIRFFECCLHVAYKLEIKKWQARTDKEKERTKVRKINIQKGFRMELGLVVDQPKPGFGSSNDGNTARRFFENSRLSATITGVDEDLIKRFHVILQTISCGHEIDLIKFQDYALQTARYFVQLYPWFYMPTSVHKILIHGAEVINSSLLPIGQMSEDAQESSNEYIKKFREDFARKCSRVKTMADIFLRLLLTSDPYISSLRALLKKNSKSLLPEAVFLLVAPSIPESSSSSSSELIFESSDCEFNYSSDDDA